MVATIPGAASSTVNDGVQGIPARGEVGAFGPQIREPLGEALILQLAEIAAIADVYDALLSDRPYRRALPLDEAVATVRAMAGPALNAEMVDAFLALVPRFPLGMRVRLEGGGFDGASAMVVDQDRFDAGRPIVRIYQDENGAPAEGRVRTADFPDLTLSALDTDERAA